MAKEYDAIIVGCGIVGLFVAYEAYRIGLSVLVLDREPEPGFGASRRHAGVIHVVQPPFGSMKSVLALEGNREYDEICRKLGVPFKRLSAILVARTFSELLFSFFVYLYLKARGYPVRWASGRELRRREPLLNRRTKGGIIVGNYGVIDSFALVYNLYDALRGAGVNFRLNCMVIGIEADDRVLVRTTCGDFVGRFLVNAAGLYADEVARMVGIGVEIKPAKGVMAVYAGRGINNIITAVPIRPHPRTKGGAIVPTPYGTIIVGPTFSEAEDKEDFSVDAENLEALRSKFEGLLEGGFEGFISVKVYAGNRALSPTGDFLVKKRGNLIHIIGTESPALTAAPAIAKMVVKLMGYEVKYVKDLNPPKPYEKLGRVVCPCRGITEGEVREAVRRGSRTLDGVMGRLGIGMGPCQGSRCVADIIRIMAEELRVRPNELTKFGEGSWLVL